MQVHFALDQEVSWSSQSGGFIKTKTGRVVQVVAAGEMPDRDRFKALYRGPGVGMARKDVSYVVLVPGASSKSAGKLYWPRTSALILAQVEGEGAEA